MNEGIQEAVVALTEHQLVVLKIALREMQDTPSRQDTGMSDDYWLLLAKIENSLTRLIKSKMPV